MLINIFVSTIIIHNLFRCLGFKGNIELDIAWEFDEGDYEGWANATSEEMQMEVRLQSGEIRGIVEGWNVNIDSPPFFLETLNRHYVILRLMYSGEASLAHLLLRYGPTPDPRQHVDHADTLWSNPIMANTISETSKNTTAQTLDETSTNASTSKKSDRWRSVYNMDIS